MKSSFLALVLLPLPLFSISALASTSNNTLKFQGEVADQTCVVDINGTANTPVVLLPTVATSDLKSPNDVAGLTSFTINLTGCSAAVSDTNISSVFQGMNTTTAGNLGNTGTATNVAIQLLDPKGDPVNLSAGMVQVPGIVLKTGASTASQDLSVQYISESGSATPGSVMATTQYAITYP